MCIIGAIKNVTITGVTQDEVTFRTDSRLTTATNDSDMSLLRILGTYTVPRADVCVPDETWKYPDGRPAESPVTLEVGQQGILYLKETSLIKVGTSAGGASVMRGASKPHHPEELLKDEGWVPLKWPKCGATEVHYSLELTMSSVLLTGYAGEQVDPVTIDLLDPTLAATSQSLSGQESGLISITLTAAGCAMFGVPPDTNPVQIWPVAITVQGSPAAATGGFCGAIDLRDRSEVWPGPSLSWTAGAQTATLDVTADGAGAFGIMVPEFLHAAEVIADHPELHAAIATLIEARGYLAGLQTRGVVFRETPKQKRFRKLMRTLFKSR